MNPQEFSIILDEQEVVVRLGTVVLPTVQVTQTSFGKVQILGGIAGPRGADGGGSSRYIHIQSSAQEVWTVNHQLNAYPNITSVQLSGPDDWEVIEGDVLYLDANTIQLTFSAAVSGRAFCS